jgi:hypothetical protein
LFIYHRWKIRNKQFYTPETLKPVDPAFDLGGLSARHGIDLRFFCWLPQSMCLGPAGSTSATTARRVKAYNKTGPVQPKKDLVTKDTALTTPQLRYILRITH